MKRKQAMAFNAGGPTANFISREDLNRICTGGFARGISLNFGFENSGGYDSYQNANGCRPKTFRQCFPMYKRSDLWERYDFDRDVWLEDVFYMGLLHENNNLNTGRPVWSWFGYRIVIEYFDDNAIVDFTGPIDKDANLSYAFGKFLVVFAKQFDIKVLNDHLLNISEKNGKEND